MPVTVDATHREVAGLYNEHHRWLSAWLRKRLGDVHQAADIAHDIFVRLLNKRYYQTVGTVFSGNMQGLPRNAMLTLRGKF